MSNPVSHLSKSFNMTSAQTSESLTIIGEVLNVSGIYNHISLELSSSGGSAVALDAFEVQIRAHKDAAWRTLLNGSYTTAADHITLAASTALNTLAHEGAGNIGLRLPPCSHVRFMSSQAASTASAVTVRARGIMSIHGIQGDFS